MKREIKSIIGQRMTGKVSVKLMTELGDGGFIRIPTDAGNKFMPVVGTNTDYIDVLGVPKYIGVGKLPAEVINLIVPEGNRDFEKWTHLVHDSGNSVSCLILSKAFFGLPPKTRAIALSRAILSKSYNLTSEERQIMGIPGSVLNGAKGVAIERELYKDFGNSALKFLKKERKNDNANMKALSKAEKKNKLPSANYKSSVVSAPKAKEEKKDEPFDKLPEVEDEAPNMGATPAEA